MNENITILIVELGKAPRPARVANILKNLQAIVGGKLEITCRLPKGSLLISNELGKEQRLQPNRRNPVTYGYIADTFFLCGYESGAFAFLTPDSRRKARNGLKCRENL